MLERVEAEEAHITARKLENLQALVLWAWMYFWIVASETRPAVDAKYAVVYIDGIFLRCPKSCRRTRDV